MHLSEILTVYFQKLSSTSQLYNHADQQIRFIHKVEEETYPSSFGIFKPVKLYYLVKLKDSLLFI